MIVAEMRTAHVPVEIFCFQVQREHIGENRIHVPVMSLVAVGDRSVRVASGESRLRASSDPFVASSLFMVSLLVSLLMPLLLSHSMISGHVCHVGLCYNFTMLIFCSEPFSHLAAW